MRIFLGVVCSLFLASVAFAADSQIWGGALLSNIVDWGRADSGSNFGQLFLWLQTGPFKLIFLVSVIAVPLAFLGHYLIIGPKIFSHDGEKIFIFPLYQRIFHFFAALSFCLLIPTGLVIIFGKYFGGGGLVEFARHLHGIATIMALFSVLPMLLFWFIDGLPILADIKWMFMLGGYLDKNIKEIPASKFNAGQKAWFWVSSVGGVIMIATGAAMFYQDFDYGIATALGISQIDLIRICAMVHSILAVLVTIFFFTHAYMCLFAIKGAVHSIINGYKEHDEVKYLHSIYYKKLKKQGKV